jgi:hypothetical protein
MNCIPTRKLQAIVTTIAVCAGCTTQDRAPSHRWLKPGDTSVVQAGIEKWTRFVIEGGFGIIYQPEGADIRIGPARYADDALPPA